MITVTALQILRPGAQDELDSLMTRLIADIRANEPGCVRFDYLTPDVDDGTRLIYEQYRDGVALRHHQNTPYLREFIPKLLELLAEPPVVTTYGDVFPRDLPPSFFHVGIIVPDLEAAVAHYSDVLQIPFAEPATFKIPVCEDPDPHPFDLTAAFSMTEPPYYELIQASGDGICSAANAGSILYYGVWETDMAGRIDHLAERGIKLDAAFKMGPDEVPYSMITTPDLSGARIEYVGIEALEPIEEWVRTGRFPGGIGG
jgi:quinol monooxygenase YgiN